MSAESLLSSSISERTRVLRGRIVPKHEHIEKKRRAPRRPKIPVIDFTRVTPAITKASLFKLPRELRDAIYQYLWTDIQIWQRYKKKYFIITYGDQDDPDSEENSTHGKARWVLTCKQMLVEGLAEFNRRAVRIFESWGKTKKSEYVFPWITPALAHKQHLYVDGRNYTKRREHGLWYFRDVPRLWRGSSSYPHIITLRGNTTGLLDLMADSDAGYNVQKIKISLRIHDVPLKCPVGRLRWRDIYRIPDIMFDFSAFDRLAAHHRLKTFEVDITVFKHGIMQSYANLDVAMENMMTELEIVRKAIMPEGQVVQTESEPGWPLVSGAKSFTFVVNKDL